MVQSLNNKVTTLYMARNIITNDFYIGVTSAVLYKRKSQHLYSVKNNSKFYFHNAIRKYGEENFIWTKIGSMPSYREGLDMEVHLIKELKPKYNMGIGGEKNSLGTKRTFEQRKKMSEIAKKVPKEVRALRSKNQSGKKHSLITKKKMSESHKGNKYCLGNKHKDSTKEKMRTAKLGKLPNNSRNIMCINDGKIYPSIRCASKFYLLNEQKIGISCRKNIPWKGMNFKYIDRDNK